jgi:hypothetical protein
MATKQVMQPTTAPNLSVSVIRILAQPWLDRTIAGVACVPLAYGVYYRYVHFHHGLPLIAAVLNTSILIVTMLIRRPPKRVTPNPWYWLLAFVASYWLVFIIFFLQKGSPLFASWITDSLAVLGLLVMLWARISLGKNIGLVPAQRELVRQRSLRLYEASCLHGGADHRHCIRASGLHSVERAPHESPRLLVHSDQEFGGGRFLAPRSTVRGIHAEGKGKVDSVCDLKALEMPNCRVPYVNRTTGRNRSRDNSPPAFERQEPMH